MKDREKLKRIECAISAITGNVDSYNGWWKDTLLNQQIDSLLFQRWAILNHMFMPTDININRLQQVNNHLYELTQQLHGRLNKMSKQLPSIMCDPQFDRDYNLEAALRFSFNGDHSVLKLDDDDYYGSDFILMIKAIYDFMSHSGIPYIEHFLVGENILDDGVSWSESPFNGSEFDSIIICHATHVLCNHNHFSIPDLIRLNDFWAEVNITVQNITPIE